MNDLKNLDYADYAKESDFEEVVELVKTTNSYTALRNMKSFFEKVRSEIINNDIYISTRQSRYTTVFDVTLSDGTKISEITVNGNCGSIPYDEIQKNLRDSYIPDVEKLIDILDERLRLAEIEEIKFEKSLKIYGLVAAIVFLVLAIEFFEAT